MTQRKITTGSAPPRWAAGHRVRVDGRVRAYVGRARRFSAGSVPKTIPGFESDGQLVQELRLGPRAGALSASAVVIGGSSRLRVPPSMMDDPRYQVVLRSCRHSSGVRRHVAARPVRSFNKRGSVVPYGGVEGPRHQPTGHGTTVSFGYGEAVSVDRRRCLRGWRRPDSHGCLPEEASSWTRPRLRPFDEPRMLTTGRWCLAVRRRADPPNCAHVGFAEAIVAIRTSSRSLVPVDYAAALGASTPTRVAFADCPDCCKRREAGLLLVFEEEPFGGNKKAGPRSWARTEGL